MRVLRFLREQPTRAILPSIAAGLFSGACSSGLLALINTALGRSERSRMELLWAFVALCALVPLTRIASELTLSRLGQQTIYDLRLQLSRQVLALPLRHLEQLGVSRILSALTEDIPAITTAVSLLPVLSINLSIVLGCLVYLGFLSVPMLAVVLGLMLAGILGYQLPVFAALRYIRRARQQQDQLFGHFRGLTEGAKELKLHRRRRESFFSEALEPTAASFRHLSIDGQRIYTVASSWGQLLLFVVIGLLLFAMPVLHIGSPGGSALTGFALGLLYLMMPLQTLMNSLPGFGQAEVALGRLEAIGFYLSEHASEAMSGGSAAESTAMESLELIGATHSYHREGEDGDFVLGPIDLRLESGELVFIAGGNGSGKTTLAKLLIGLYVPETGEVRLNGETITEKNREDFRQHFSVVFSDFFLFDNLFGLEAPGHHGEMDARVGDYLARLHLADKVSVRAGRLSTTELSHGQRKRLALLTAYLEDRPIYVFDEWAADQDPFFKEIFYLELLPDLKRRGKTVVVISHDDRYYGAADRLIKLDAGEIVADSSTRAQSAVGPGVESPGIRA